jgi:hypothetical protein
MNYTILARNIIAFEIFCNFNFSEHIKKPLYSHSSIGIYVIQQYDFLRLTALSLCMVKSARFRYLISHIDY